MKIQSLGLRSFFCFWVLAGGLSARTACGQIFVVTNDSTGLHNCAILKYDFNGTYLDTILLPNNDARAVAISGTNLYVACRSLGTVAKYSTSGATINPALISGLNQPSALTVNGTNLYVADVNYIRKYNTDGAVINATLIATPPGNLGAGSYGVVTIGTNLFASYPSGNIAKYTLDGAIVNGTLVTGLSVPGGLATDGVNLFVANWGGSDPGWVGEYTASGSPVAIKLISNLYNGAISLALGGTNVYVIYGNNTTIGKYTTLGTTVNATLIVGGYNSFVGLAVSYHDQTSSPPAVGITLYSNQPAVIWPASGGNFVLQMSTNLASGNWTSVTNYQPVSGALITNAPTPAFFRLK